LKDTVAAVKRTIEVEVDDKIITAQVMGSAWAGLDEFPSLESEQQAGFPFAYFIPRTLGLFHQVPGVGNDFDRNPAGVFKNSSG